MEGSAQEPTSKPSRAEGCVVFVLYAAVVAEMCGDVFGETASDAVWQEARISRNAKLTETERRDMDPHRRRVKKIRV